MVDIDEEREAEFERRLREIALSAASELDCEIFLFGSRAQKRTRRSSDFDIGIRGLSERDFRNLKEQIEEAVEESSIPHEVDVVDFDRANEPFKSIAMKERVVWKSV
jgi:predicted nucleotidyltransferase